MNRFLAALKETIALTVWIVLVFVGVFLLVMGVTGESWGYAALGFLCLFIAILYMNWYHHQ